MHLLAALAFLLPVPAQEEKVDDAAVKRLIDQLGADFLEERETARKALEKVGKQAEARLVEALAAPDHRVRKNSLELLTAFKSARARDRAAELFRGDEDGSVRDAAFRLLQALGKDAEDHLIAALDSPNPDHRRGAIQSLTEIKSEKSADRMAELHDREPDKEVKAAAFKCLQSLGQAAEPHLLRYLKSPDAGLRRDALEGLRKSQNEAVLAAVGQLFGAETEVPVINNAFEHLRAAGEKAEQHFVAGLRSSQEHTRSKSIEGLRALKSEAAIGEVAKVFENDASDTVRSGAADFLKSHGLKSEEPLLKALAKENPKVKLQAIQALGEIKSEKPLEQIARLFREDKNKEVHKVAFDYLRQLGLRAEKDLLFALSDEDKEIKRLAILTLGNARSEAAIPELIKFLGQVHDQAVKEAARDALVRIGPKAVEAARRSAAAGDVTKEVADTIGALFYQEEVERILDRHVTEEGGSGFYEGQFADLERFGKDKALPVLRRMVREPGYAYRLADRRERVYQYEFRMRELAIMALGEMGDADSVEALKEALKEAAPGGADSTHEEILVALFRLGEKKPLEDFVAKSWSDAEAALRGDAKDDGCGLLFSLGLVLNRVGRRDQAAEAYGKLVRAVEEHKLTASAKNVLPAATYNLACLNALKGDKARALEWLEKAVKAGFKDRQWIRMDKDLDALRDEQAYKSLLANDKLFESGLDD
jgi:HEAT repeat protein